MIPPLNEQGYLPAGLHAATVAEIEARFGHQSELRRDQMESIRWLVDLAIRAGVQRVVLNGSFVTDRIEPNDVDCVLLISAETGRDETAEGELAEGLPFLDISLVGQRDFDYLVGRFFAADRSRQAKGMIEIVL